jgi:hypothetical protein
MKFSNLTQANKPTPSLKALKQQGKEKTEKKERKKKEAANTLGTGKVEKVIHRTVIKKVEEPGNQIPVNQGALRVLGQGCDVCGDTVMHCFNTETKEIICLGCRTITNIANRPAKQDIAKVLRNSLVQRSLDLLNLFI